MRVTAVTARATKTIALLDARAAVAKRYPGCVTAILSPNMSLNWDSGALVREQLEKQLKGG